MAKLNSLHDLLIDELKDLYSAETQLLKALPKMAKAASSPELKQAFEGHLEETEIHVDRLESVLKELDASPRGKTCKAMKGLIEEGADVIKEKAEASVKDAALISAGQRVEHYEIAGYGTARAFAEVLDLDKIAQTLQETLDEEGAADKKLTDIAMSINVEAEEPAVQ